MMTLMAMMVKMIMMMITMMTMREMAILVCKKSLPALPGIAYCEGEEGRHFSTVDLSCSMLQETPCLFVSCSVDGVDSGVGRGRVVLDKVVGLGGQMLIVDVSSQKRILACRTNSRGTLAEAREFLSLNI